MAKPKNDRNLAVSKFCLAMECHRRSEAGRVRTAKEFVAHFFPYDEKSATDRLFCFMPNDVRGPVLATWGIRGAKAALKDDDTKVKLVVHDSLLSGDLDEAAFEGGVESSILIDWIALDAWWTFWRQGTLSGVAVQKALATARELELIDDAWFLLNVQGRGGKLKGTDVLCDTLSKEQIVAWVRKLHENGDGSPAGIVAAIGWDTLLSKTAQEALLFALDRFADKAGLTTTANEAASSASARQKQDPNAEVRESASVRNLTSPPLASAGSNAFAKTENPQFEPSTTRHQKLAETHPTMSAPSHAVAMAEAEALAQSPRVGGFALDAAEIPVIESNDYETSEHPALRDPITSTAYPQQEESAKLVEARAAMMLTLMASSAPDAAKREPWDDSEVPAKPSSLEWSSPLSIPEDEAALDSSDEIDSSEGSEPPNERAQKEPSRSPPPVPKRPGSFPRGR